MTNREQARGELRERFYQSVAETLALLHAAPGHERRQSMQQIADILASTMNLPLVWIGRREANRDEVEILAAAGPASEYAAALRLTTDEARPGGRGPVAIALREQRARAVSIDAPEFAPWRAAAVKYGFGSCIVAVSLTREGGQLTLTAYSRNGEPALSEEFLEWAQRLADELARFWDHQALLERSIRINRYRDAQRTIQRALLDQPDPEAVYHTLARALADIAGAAAVDLFAADGADGMMRRVALVGPIASVVLGLPLPPQHDDGDEVLAPTLCCMQGIPIVRRHPASQPGPPGAWRPELLEHAGAVGCWPLFATSVGELDTPRRPVGVFVVVTTEPDAFDDEMCRLLDEIAEAASLAFKQHAQRYALSEERERQTYLALHDDLTDLPNRRALDHYMETVLARAERRGRQVAIGLLDLDDLKPVNDRHGHAMGDRVLVEVAKRLRLALRSQDYVARLGGDEFVLVLEDLDDEAGLTRLLDRVGDALMQPLQLDHLSLRLAASLGIAVYSAEAHASGEQLMRRADQAMYRVKAAKRHRACWWAMARNDGTVEASGVLDAGAPPYGDRAAHFLAGSHQAWQSQLPDAIKSYVRELLQHEGIARLFGVLPEADTVGVKHYLTRHLLTLIDPALDAATHRASAARAGMFHAACGLEEVWLLEGIELLRELLVTRLSAVGHTERGAVMVLSQRFAMEQQWELESMRELQRARVALLARLNALAWSSESYLQLIQGVVDLMVSHKEFVACAVGRPNASGELTYEAVAGAAFARYVRALASGHALPIRVDANQREGAGPSGRAWRTSNIHRCAHYGSDPLMAGWRDMALSLGVVSNVAIPLCPSPHQPAAVLTLYSPYAGGLQSEDQQAFLEQMKSVLDLALARLAPPRLGAELLPFFVRERWRGAIDSEALEMHYQPVVRLADGKVAEFEALARLRDDDGTLLSPARFLPALGTDELVALFRRGLSQAVACREALQHGGHALDMSVNVPAAALEDPRYAEVAAAIIAESGCPADALLLEILESPIGTEHAALLDEPGMQLLKALGVRLVEDDLGAGYSSLIRLRQWPFDRIKIDQAIVGQATRDPLGTLRFVRQLIRIGHDLALEVVIEGLESAGLIEAAAMLGADFGQGYALARPMPPQSLLGWLDEFRLQGRDSLPQTGLGTLAAELRWEEQFLALPPEPESWLRHARVRSNPGEYLGENIEASEALLGSREAMHAAAVEGPSNPAYRHHREQFLSLLIARIVADESRNAE